MVATTLVKLGGPLKYPKVHIGLPGLSLASLRHHYSALPVYVFTFGGGLVCTLYCIKLGLYQDTTFAKWRPFKDISPSAKVPILVSREVVSDLANLNIPDNRTQVKEGQQFED